LLGFVSFQEYRVTRAVIVDGRSDILDSSKLEFDGFGKIQKKSLFVNIIEIHAPSKKNSS
jgi:hypothetical protein